MSSVHVYRIDRAGILDNVDDASNAHSFFVAIWHHLMLKHGILPPGSGPTLQLSKLGQLWVRVAKLPRLDGLLCAATFDRAWFPRDTITDLCVALDGGAQFARTCSTVSAIVKAIEFNDGDRGVCFGSSLNNTWNCSKSDDHHVLGDGGHKCKACGKRAQNVEHMLRSDECCRETEDPSEYRDR